jgi:trans-2,3-dihydro-3-hydroxyanthranilate isomerase
MTTVDLHRASRIAAMTTRQYPFHTVDVFTTQRFGGNPLAVVLDAEGLSDDEMQALAAEFNYSETTFVLPPSDPVHTACVRIFNRTYEMPFAGHPNVGTAFVLASLRPDLSDVLVFEEQAGLVEVRIDRNASGEVQGALIEAPQPLLLGPTLPVDAIAACLGLEPSDLVTTSHHPQVTSVGVTFVLAEVRSAALGRAAPDPLAFRALLDRRPDLNGRLSAFFYASEGRTQVRARMFAPLAGTWEDPATGSASAALAALRLSLESGDTVSLVVQQGIEMGRPSLLTAGARRERDGIRATVRGTCVPVFQGQARL